MREVLSGNYVRVHGKNYEICMSCHKGSLRTFKAILVDKDDKTINLDLSKYDEVNGTKVAVPLEDLEIESAFSCSSYCRYNGLEDCGARKCNYGEFAGKVLVMPPDQLNSDEEYERYGFEKCRFGSAPKDYLYHKVLNEDEVEGLWYHKIPLDGYPFDEEDNGKEHEQ